MIEDTVAGDVQMLKKIKENGEKNEQEKQENP